MKFSDFDFKLPQELIAQFSAGRRDHLNLLVPDDSGNQIVKFYNLPDYLLEGDLLVFNDSRVIKARLTLYAGSEKININLNKPSGSDSWFGFAKPAKKLSEGDEFVFDNHKLAIKRKLDAGVVEIEFQTDGISIFDFLDKYGQVPLPQYI